MKKEAPNQNTDIPAHLKVALTHGVKKPAVTYPKIDLELLVKTTLAMPASVNPKLSPSEAREAYKRLAHEAVLVIEGCQQILAARESMQAILDKEAAIKERELLPRNVSFADGVYGIVGDRNPGPKRGCEKLKKFLSAFYGELILSEDGLPPCEEWVEAKIEYWRENRFNADEVDVLRDRRNDYIKRGILHGDPVRPKIIEKSAFLSPSDPTTQISDARAKSSDRKRRKTRQRAKRF